MAASEAALEQEVTREISLRLSREQAERLEQAASATGQSLAGFATSALLSAADTALTSQSVPLRHKSLGGVLGIFQDEPLMDELMERIHEERRAEVAVYTGD